MAQGRCTGGSQWVDSSHGSCHLVRRKGYMAKVNAAQWLDKWGRRLSQAGPDITAGVNRVTVAPGVAAAAAAPRMLTNLTQSVQSGAWAARVSAVPLQSWKDSMNSKTLPRLQQGIDQATKTKTGAITTFLSAVDAAVADTNALPRGSVEQNIARSAAFQRSMSARAPKRQH